jgi:RimJ/RimL family protein N-acetyltransferase
MRVAQWMVAPPDWYQPDAFRDGDLGLELLHPKHACPWRQQNRDGSVAERTRLPEFDSLEQTSRWLSQRWAATHEPIEDDRQQCFSFAIVHEQRGFVGSISLHRLGRRAFFSFWVGPAHQGLGFGTRAVVLLNRAVLCGLHIDELFTAVEPENRRSRSALKKSGWQCLPFSAQPPEHRVLLCRWGPSSVATRMEISQAAHRLAALLSGLGSDFVLEPGSHEFKSGQAPVRQPENDLYL